LTTAPTSPGIAYLALGNTLIRQGRLGEAEQAHSTALRMIGSTLGKTHHRYADACYKMGWHLDRQAKYHDSL
jgi:cytochrome c-type biogenesis protein CcmH/NrfG